MVSAGWLITQYAGLSRKSVLVTPIFHDPNHSSFFPLDHGSVIIPGKMACHFLQIFHTFFLLKFTENVKVQHKSLEPSESRLLIEGSPPSNTLPSTSLNNGTHPQTSTHIKKWTLIHYHLIPRSHSMFCQLSLTIFLKQPTADSSFTFTSMGCKPPFF